jgi:hypothetical protein
MQLLFDIISNITYNIPLIIGPVFLIAAMKDSKNYKEWKEKI